MKKQLFYSMLLAGALAGFTSCSSDTNDQGEEIVNNGEVKTSYIAVNISEPESLPGTRAEGYESGNATEYAFNNVRFFFFNSDGSPYTLTNSTPANVNWLDVDVNPTQNPTAQQMSSETIERVSNTVLVIEHNTGSNPAIMIAIANPGSLTNANTQTTEPILSNSTSMTLSQVQDASRLTSTFYNTTLETFFVMSNSAYYENGSYRASTPTTGLAQNTEALALANPVKIYVERLAAKVKVTYPSSTSASNWSTSDVDGDGDEEVLYDLGSYTYVGNNGVDTTVDHVYAVIENWGLADEMSAGKLVKDLTSPENWQTNLGISPWSASDYHRSFWEISPEFNGSSNKVKDYAFSAYTKQIVADNYNLNGATVDDNVIYTMPNTPTTVATSEEANRSSDQTYRTKVLLAVKLMYKDSNGDFQPAEVSTYRGTSYLGENAVKAVMLNEVANYICKKTRENSWGSLTADDIEFDANQSTVTVNGNTTNIKSYQVVPKLKSSTTNIYALCAAGDATASTQTVNYDEANGEFQEHLSGRYAEIRKSGNTYYYTAIRHLASQENQLGYFGVVRNHFYKVNITGLTGFGTPVYDPDKTIIPVTPSSSETFLAAQINVLQWHVVNSNVNINSTPKTN